MLLYATSISMAIGLAGVLVTYASQAFADDQQSNSTNPQAHGGDRFQWIKSMIVKDIRDHKDMRWTGLTTDSHSLVPGVKILGVVETSNSTVSVTLAHVTMPTANSDIAIDGSAVKDNVTLTAIAFNSHKDPHSHLDGSVNVPSGWSGTTTVNVQLAGSDPVFDYHFIRVVALQSTGQ